MSDQPAELPLRGGTAHRGLVVRVGETVRKPQRSNSEGTHALLQHLHDIGFDSAPRYLGTDDRGREVLSFVEGEAVTWPYPAWALTEAALTSVAELLRRYHDAVATFNPAPYRWPQSPPRPYAGAVVSHNDPNLDNVVFRNGRAAALIDFDLASPGSTIWDVAAAARLWAPLRPDADIADARRGQALRRFTVFATAYGMRDFEPGQLVDAVSANHDWLYSIIRSGAEAGSVGYASYWEEVADRAERTRSWYTTSRQQLIDTLTTIDPRDTRRAASRWSAG